MKDPNVEERERVLTSPLAEEIEIRRQRRAEERSPLTRDWEVQPIV